PGTSYDFYIANTCMSVDTTMFKGPFTLTTDALDGEFSFIPGQATGNSQNVDFTALETADTYNWDFGDGTDSANAGANISHTYTANGTYYVTLTITDNVCGNATYTDTVE